MTERNPRYDGLNVFKLDLSKLRPGDVLLTRSVETKSWLGKLVSYAIGKLTGGTFSHALLCTTPPTFIEAIDKGTSNLSGQNCFAHDLKNVRLLRYHDGITADKAARAALPLLGQKYSIQGALRSILPDAQIPEVPEDQIFCSALVAAAFRKAGAPEFSTINPMKVTPAALEKSSHFTDVTTDVFLEILSPRNIEEMSALDGDRVISPMAEQVELFQSYYVVLLPLIQKFMAETPELTFKVTPKSFIECVMFIVAAKSACDGLPTHAEKARADIAAIDGLAYDLLADGRFEEMVRITNAKDEESNQYTLAQSYNTNADINLADVKSLINATKQQIEARSGILTYTSNPGNSLVFDKWLSISTEFIDSLNRRVAILEEALARAYPGHD